MRDNNFFTKFIQRMKAGKKSTREKNESANSRAMMGNLLRMVEKTDEVEIGCDEVFELLDQYIEIEQRGEDVSKLIPLVEQHLDKCRDCREEYEALKRVIESTTTDNR